MKFEKYFDKVFGCYLGKSVGGTFGAPFEGIKQRLDIKFDKDVTKKMLMNDDLDLQILFLEAVKKYGENFNSMDLAELFYHKYPYSPGEYAYFKKNYERGVNPPYSGSFNNDFYSEGMGCCIRGELWGCLFPLNFELVKKYTTYDGCLDHSTESILSENFIGNLVAECFFETDIKSMIAKCIAELPKSKFKSMAKDVVKWSEQIDNHFEIRDKIIANYGHPDCTNIFQNMGIIIMCLLKYFDDFIEMCEKSNACGFDTDCTVGICAALYGAYHGADSIKQILNVDDVSLVMGALCDDYGKSVKRFSYEVAKYGYYFNKINEKFNITDAPEFEYQFEKHALFELLEYSPVLAVGSKQVVRIKASNCTLPSIDNTKIIAPYGFEAKIINLEGNIIEILCSMSENEEFSDKNIFTLSVNEEKYYFGFYTPQVLYVSRPYFENFYDVDTSKYENYYDFFRSINNKDNAIRNFHLSYTIDTSKDYLNLKEISLGNFHNMEKTTSIGDKIDVNKIIDYNGPCVLYVAKEFYSDEQLPVRILIGASDYVKVYFNGEQLLESDESGFFTFEKHHLSNVVLKKGKNILAYKIVRRNNGAEYSGIITYRGELLHFPKHVLGFKQKIRG